jgi:ABC-type dipeptide/oligopeptide/nickel transport system permease component
VLDFGTSIRYKQPVRDVMLERMPATIELGVVATIMALAIGVPLGVLAGVRAGSKVDGGARVLGLFGQTVPDFWLALVLILVFSVGLGWFPPFGRETMSLGPITVPDRSVILPAFALSLFPAAQLLGSPAHRCWRSSTRTTFGSHGAKAFRPGWSTPGHVLRNADPVDRRPQSPGGRLLSGSLYIEAVFSWPGAGGLMAEAVGNRDFELVQGSGVPGRASSSSCSRCSPTSSTPSPTPASASGHPDDRRRDTARAQRGLRVRRGLRVGRGLEPAAGSTRRRSALRSPGGLFGAASCSSWWCWRVFAPLIAPHDPLAQNLAAANTPPFFDGGSWLHRILGTDSLGRDILSRLIYGTRVSLTVAVGGVLIAMVLGMLLGSIAGYAAAGSTADRGANDLLLSVPYVLLVVVIAAVVGKSLVNVILIFGLTDIPIFVRVTRGEVLKLSESTFVEAARAWASRGAASSVASAPEPDRVRSPRWPPSRCRR